MGIAEFCLGISLLIGAFIGISYPDHKTPDKTNSSAIASSVDHR